MSGERFYIDNFGGPIRCYDKDGEYVSYKDYESLKAENEMLRTHMTNYRIENERLMTALKSIHSYASDIMNYDDNLATMISPMEILRIAKSALEGEGGKNV